MACAWVVECLRAYGKVCLLYRVTRLVASSLGWSMTNGANYKRGKSHHSPWHSHICTSNQLNNLHIKEIRKMYHNNCQRVNLAEVIHCYNLQSYYSFDMNLHAYANWLQCNWRDAELVEVQVQQVLYNVVWANMTGNIYWKLDLFTIRQWTFNTIHELVNRGADVEIVLELTDM